MSVGADLKLPYPGFDFCSARSRFTVKAALSIYYSTRISSCLVMCRKLEPSVAVLDILCHYTWDQNTSYAFYPKYRLMGCFSIAHCMISTSCSGGA